MVNAGKSVECTLREQQVFSSFQNPRENMCTCQRRQRTSACKTRFDKRSAQEHPPQKRRGEIALKPRGTKRVKELLPLSSQLHVVLLLQMSTDRNKFDRFNVNEENRQYADGGPEYAFFAKMDSKTPPQIPLA